MGQPDIRGPHRTQAAGLDGAVVVCQPDTVDGASAADMLFDEMPVSPIGRRKIRQADFAIKAWCWKKKVIIHVAADKQAVSRVAAGRAVAGTQ